MLMTTGYDFQGYYIAEYKDVIFDEILVGLGLGKGIASSFDNFFSALSGGEASTMVKRLNEVKQMLRKRVIEKAQANGANGLIGIDFESSKLGDLLMVSMTATAVRVVKIVGPLPVTEEDSPRQTLSELNVRKLNALLDDLYRKNLLEGDDALNVEYQQRKAERDAAEKDMRALYAVFAEKKAVLDQMLSTIESVKGKIAEAQKAVEQLERYGSQRTVSARIEEKNSEIRQTEAELTQLLEKAEALKQDVRVTRDAAKEKREKFQAIDGQLVEFMKHNNL